MFDLLAFLLPITLLISAYTVSGERLPVTHQAV